MSQYFNISTIFETNLEQPGVVIRQNDVKEDVQNKALFEYYMPNVGDVGSCATMDLRPQDTRHTLLGTNTNDTIRNNYIRPFNHTPSIDPPGRQPCPISPFVPSWKKYSASINNESDMKNIIRKRSCDPNSVYIPSTSSMMYSRGGMVSDTTIESGRNAIRENLNTYGVYPHVFMEDTRQQRMNLSPI